MFRPLRGFLIVAAALALAPIAASAQEKGKGPPPLPEGKGKQFVEGICSTCHATQLIVNSSGYTREQWRELTSYMIDLSKSPQQSEILDYLAPNFPPHNNGAAKTVTGHFKVSLKEWGITPPAQGPPEPI